MASYLRTTDTWSKSGYSESLCANLELDFVAGLVTYNPGSSHQLRSLQTIWTDIFVQGENDEADTQRAESKEGVGRKGERIKDGVGKGERIWKTGKEGRRGRMRRKWVQALSQFLFPPLPEF